MKSRAEPPGKKKAAIPPKKVAVQSKKEPIRPKKQAVPQAQTSFTLGKKLVFSATALVLSFMLLEVLLAVVGIRPERAEYDPYAGFSSNYPLFVEEPDAAGQALMVTAKNRLDFFNLQRFPKVKAPGTFRLFSLGGSTTYGHPYSDSTSFNGWLRELLHATAPDRKWEAINAGGISYGSARVVGLMHELVRYQPDLFLVYCGQNEFLERHLEAKIAVHGPFARLWFDLAARSRSATLMKRLVTRSSSAKDSSSQATPTVAREPVTLLDNTLGPTAYARDDALRRRTFEQYRANLKRMIEIAQSAGAHILFVVPASNIRDVSPFKSRVSDALSQTNQTRWLQLYRLAHEDYANPIPTNGLAALSEAAAIDERSANLHFLRGRILEKLGQFAEAKAAYERALEEDLCPLRAPAAIRQGLREVAAEARVPLVDFEVLQESHSEHGIPGAAVFLDHVHPTIEANRLLALEILKAMEKEGDVKPDMDPAIIQRVTQEVMGRIDNRANSLALMNLCKTLGWAGKREEAYRTGMQAIRLGPDIAAVHFEAGLAAQLYGRTDQAMEQYARAVELDPTHGDAHCNLGVLLEDRGELAQAITQYRLAVQYGKPVNAKRDGRNLASALEKSRALPGAK
jgi:tetratricopeptide (TPR) repeat protein